MAIAYGNCHMEAIQAYLERHKEFSAEYGFYPLPKIYELKRINEYRNVFQVCNLFLHQSIRKNNVYGEEYSSENVLSYLDKKCAIIVI